MLRASSGTVDKLAVLQPTLNILQPTLNILQPQYVNKSIN